MHVWLSILLGPEAESTGRVFIFKALFPYLVSEASVGFGFTSLLLVPLTPQRLLTMLYRMNFFVQIHREARPAGT